MKAIVQSALGSSRNKPFWSTRRVAFTIISAVALMGSLVGPSEQSAGAAVGEHVRAWGDNSYGQLGNDNAPNDSHTRITVPNLTNVKRISGGCDYAVALKKNGTVRTWGINSNGQLGNADAPNDSHVPVAVSGLDDVKAIAAGAQHALALKENGTVRSWGSNLHGELGNDDAPNDSDVPVTVNGLDNVKAIAAGQNTSFALKENGTVRSWGKNDEGQLGNGDEPNDSHVPVTVSGLENVKAIATHCEGYHVLAIKQNGTVRTWGYNSSGEIGDGSLDSTDTPVRVVQLKDVVAVAGGYQHSLALKENGAVWAFGENGDGQLGDETTVDKPVPVRVEHLKGVKAIAAGEYTGLALKRDGTVRAWGVNGDGQLGDDSIQTRYLPVRVHNLSNVRQVAAGTDSSYALRE